MAELPFASLPEPEEEIEDLSAALEAMRTQKIKAAMAWLREALKDGPRPATELEEEARAVGIPHTTLEHAKKRLYAHSERRGNRYFWYLPAHKKQAIASAVKVHTS